MLFVLMIYKFYRIVILIVEPYLTLQERSPVAEGRFSTNFFFLIKKFQKTWLFAQVWTRS